MRKRILLCLGLLLTACGSGKDEGPTIFLPEFKTPDGMSLTERKEILCRGVDVELQDKILTPENFRAVFNCANYDEKLNDLEPLVTHKEFPNFLENINAVMISDGKRSLKDSLKDWLSVGPEGTSRVERLLPLISKVIKHPSFQDGFPILNELLSGGEEVWRDLAPGLSILIYQERYPDALHDLADLFSATAGTDSANKDYATPIKNWANFLAADVDGKTVSGRVVDLAHRVKDIQIPNGSLPEYLHLANEKGVIASLYLESGEARGEVLDPRLNEEPGEEEIAEGLTLTPEERQDRALRKLFRRGMNGEDAPIVQLAGVVEEFHREHPDFIPALARWFSANGPKVMDGLSQYVIQGKARVGITNMKVDAFLKKFVAASGRTEAAKVTGPEFSAFLNAAFASPDFTAWLKETTYQYNKEQYGAKNAELLLASPLVSQAAAIYSLPAVSEFGGTLIPAGKDIALSLAITRFSNVHRSDKLKIDLHGTTQSIEGHFVDLWWQSAKTAFGENVVLGYGIELVQTAFNQMAQDFGKNGLTLSEWYYARPYANPATFETALAYALKEFHLIDRMKEHEGYLKETFAAEVFPEENDRRAFRLLVDQTQNIVLYFRSGMARSGNDLTRALAEKDTGYLIRNYVNIIVSATRSGWIKDGARLIEAFHEKFPYVAKEPHPRTEEETEKISAGVDAAKLLARALLKPEKRHDYSTSTLGRALVPIQRLFLPENQAKTEQFLLTGANEVSKLSDEKINEFFRDLSSQDPGDFTWDQRREGLKNLAGILADPVFPKLVRQAHTFLKDEAVKPALDFFAKKIDDGSIPETILFISRLLGYRA